MNRSSRGFGLTGVALAVIFMIITAVFSSSASAEAITDQAINQSTK
ncbi:hypothetical protein [Salinimonas sediminis]|nr:hypothetical protein [Salinimonas sediminis]